MRRPFLPFLLALIPAAGVQAAPRSSSSALVLDGADFRHYVEFFNAMVPEGVMNAIPNERAWEWIEANAPLFTCPNPEVERTYYYRWWTFRKHIKETPSGYVLTEFIRPVKHATDHNAISCALGHHIAEGRWLRNREYIEDYLNFWLRSGEGGGLQSRYHAYSNWTASAVYDRWLVDGDTKSLVSMLEPLILDYETWEKERLLPNGLFWQYDVRDGMEESVSGSRKAKNARPTINSYMYGNATALAAIAELAGRKDVAATYRDKAKLLRQLVQASLWDSDAGFFKPLMEAGGPADVREIIGYTPWLFNLPEQGHGYERAWAQLMDPKGFYAPYGPTTAEQRHPGFQIAETGDDCQWNGPSWPFSTTVTLKALANVLNGYKQSAITKHDYVRTFLIYTNSHQLKLPDGRVIPWVDENLNPFTGEWHARLMKIREGKFNGRGDHYNHSGYTDVVISGLVGLRPRADEVVEVNPLLPSGTWDWFCLDDVPYHGRTLTIIWDRTGEKFRKGKGLRVFADGREVASAATLRRVTGQLPAAKGGRQ